MTSVLEKNPETARTPRKEPGSVMNYS